MGCHDEKLHEHRVAVAPLVVRLGGAPKEREGAALVTLVTLVSLCAGCVPRGAGRLLWLRPRGHEGSDRSFRLGCSGAFLSIGVGAELHLRGTIARGRLFVLGAEVAIDSPKPRGRPRGRRSRRRRRGRQRSRARPTRARARRGPFAAAHVVASALGRRSPRRRGADGLPVRRGEPSAARPARLTIAPIADTTSLA